MSPPAHTKRYTRPLTSSLSRTVLHSHLHTEGIDGYEVDGAQTWVDPNVSAHVNQPKGFLTR